LLLAIDLDEEFLRRKRGEAQFFEASKNDLLPRMMTGQFARQSRREQKMYLAQVLFSEDGRAADSNDGTIATNTTVTAPGTSPMDDNMNPCEVYVDHVDGKEDAATKQRRYQRLQSSKECLRLSLALRETSCVSMALSEISKRYLNVYGKARVHDALRCSEKAIEVVTAEYWDSDEMELEVRCPLPWNLFLACSR
jgi:hypothetical protein